MVLPVIEMFEHKDGTRFVLHGLRREAGHDCVLSNERRLPPGTGRGLPHRHTDCEERFAVRSGRATLIVEGDRRELGPGELVVIPPGVPHVDPFNETDEQVEVIAAMSPGPEFAYIYGRTLGRALRDGKVNSQRQLKPLHMMVVLHDTGSKTYAAGVPILLQRYFTIPLAAWLGRILGFRAATR